MCVTSLSGKIQSKKAATIWVTIWWCIWKVQNDMIFNNAVFDSEELFYSILWYTWWWLTIVVKDRITCNFYEWLKTRLCAFEFDFYWISGYHVLSYKD